MWSNKKKNRSVANWFGHQRKDAPTMKCYICDRDDDGISWNSLHQDFNPCFTCQAVINGITYKNSGKDEVELDEEADEVLYG